MFYALTSLTFHKNCCVKFYQGLRIRFEFKKTHGQYSNDDIEKMVYEINVRKIVYAKGKWKECQYMV